MNVEGFNLLLDNGDDKEVMEKIERYFGVRRSSIGTQRKSKRVHSRSWPAWWVKKLRDEDTSYLENVKPLGFDFLLSEICCCKFIYQIAQISDFGVVFFLITEKNIRLVSMSNQYSMNVNSKIISFTTS